VYHGQKPENGLPRYRRMLRSRLSVGPDAQHLSGATEDRVVKTLFVSLAATNTKEQLLPPTGGQQFLSTVTLGSEAPVHE